MPERASGKCGRRLFCHASCHASQVSDVAVEPSLQISAGLQTNKDSTHAAETANRHHFAYLWTQKGAKCWAICSFNADGI